MGQVSPLDLTQDSEDVNIREGVIIPGKLRNDIIDDSFEVIETSKSSVTYDSSRLSFDAYQSREDETASMEEDYKYEYKLSEESKQDTYKQSPSPHTSIATETQILKASSSVLQETDDYASMLS